jgi:hypothetical protein
MHGTNKDRNTHTHTHTHIHKHTRTQIQTHPRKTLGNTHTEGKVTYRRTNRETDTEVERQTE